MSSNKIKTSLIFTLLHANSQVFYSKYFIQNQCQNSLIFILLLFQLRFFVRHFLVQKIAAPGFLLVSLKQETQHLLNICFTKTFPLFYFLVVIFLTIEFKKKRKTS